MKKEYIEKFLNGKLVFRLNGDESLLEMLQNTIESYVKDINKKSRKYDLFTAKSIGTYAYEQNKENACISWDGSCNMFGWCEDYWYVDHGYEIIPIEEVFSDESSSNTEEWTKLL